MEAVLCDTSAFLYWRTPPLVRLLASEPEDSPLLRELLAPAEIRSFRHALRESTPLCAAATGPGRGRAHPGRAAGAVASSATALSVALSPPVDLLVCHASERSASTLVRPRLCAAPPEPDGWRQVAPGIGVASPLFSLQQIAARCSLARTVMLASELCGSFSVYVPPEPVRSLLQRLIDEGRLPRVSNWSPTLDHNGRLTELWTRPPLATPEQIRDVGIDVVSVTYGQLASPARFDALAQLIAQKLGMPWRERTPSEAAAASRLRKEVFADWATLPVV